MLCCVVLCCVVLCLHICVMTSQETLLCFGLFKVWKKYVKCVIFGIFIMTAVFSSYFIWSAVSMSKR